MATTTYPLAVTAADLDKLQAAAIQMIRLQHSNGSYDWQTNGGVRKTGMAAAACVAEFTKADA